MAPRRYYDGSAFERVAAYARAARGMHIIAVSGTAALSPDGSAMHEGDTYAQTLDAFRRGLRAVSELGGAPRDVIRTRMYLVQQANWRDAARAHREVFEGIDPASTTLYVAGFIPEGVLVEVELDAEVDE